MKKFIWLGSSGYNPKVGKVVAGEPVSINDKQLQDFLLNSGLIEEPVESKTLSRKKDGRKEKTGKTAEKSKSGKTGYETGTETGTETEENVD